MNAQLAAAQVARAGPNYLYPDHAIAPGLVNPTITQANIHQTICSPTWSTKSIRACVVRPRDISCQTRTRNAAGADATGRLRLVLRQFSIPGRRGAIGYR
jgi:hypothetical protein